MVRIVRPFLSTVAMSLAIVPALPAQQPPITWVDKDTGHRIHRLTKEADSSGFYFNVNAYSPDGKLMAYDAPDCIHVLGLTTITALSWSSLTSGLRCR
jgi:oligogalacturonide lyase